MEIFIINPNSNLEMEFAIRKSAENYAKTDFIVVCKSNLNGPRFIATYEDEVRTAPGMIDMVRENEKRFDAFIVAAHNDPNIDVLRVITNKPVIGIAEASMKIASMLGHKFSVIAPARYSIPNKEALIRKYHLQDLVASVRSPIEEMKIGSKEDMFLETARLAVEEDMAETIVLGCAGMAGLDRKIEKELNVPVLDGVVCALIIATGLVRYGVSTSKIRRYNPEVGHKEMEERFKKI